MKITFRIIQSLLLIFVVIISFSNNTLLESELVSDDINKLINLSKMQEKVEQFNYDDVYGVKDTYTGDLTGYAYNCPACTGKLACNSRYDLSDGTITYPDQTYGEVRIVASSRNLPCGTIIRFTSSRVSDEPVIAIVLDRGVLGNAIDLLTPSEAYAAKYIGRSSITYDVLREGW